VDVVHLDVHLDDPEPGHFFDLAHHVPAYGVADVHDAHAVPGDEVEVDGCFAFADLYRDSLGCGSARVAARNDRLELADSSGHAGSHRVDARYVAGGQPGDFRYHTLSDAGCALLGGARHRGLPAARLLRKVTCARSGHR
jgi:hypothetical protein